MPPVIPRSIYHHRPWRNGGGVTEDIVSGADGGWRLSLATIERDGPFSDFTGFDRTIVAVDGSFLLRFEDGEEVQVRALEPFRFAGERRVAVTGLDHPIHAFNVMTLRRRFRHTVRVTIGVPSLSELPPAASYAFFLEGAHSGDTLRLTGMLPEAMAADGYILATIAPGEALR